MNPEFITTHGKGPWKCFLLRERPDGLELHTYPSHDPHRPFTAVGGWPVYRTMNTCSRCGAAVFVDNEP